jgi:2-polyprenyl-3-methyl-5-hydroxy-6-metoxy-1,4-benzoquinol methylase
MSKYEQIKKHWETIHHIDGLHKQEEGIFAEILVEKAKTSEKVLEIGVGHGRMIRYLLANGVNKSKLHSIDIIETNEPITEHYENIELTEYASRESNIGQYDLVYSLGVIEHGENVYHLFKSQIDLVKEGGLAIFTTPALSLETILRVWSYFRKKLYLKGRFNQIKGANLTISKFRKYCQQYGLRNENIIIKRVGPLVRYKDYGEMLQKYESKLGSTIIVIIKK